MPHCYGSRVFSYYIEYQQFNLQFSEFLSEPSTLMKKKLGGGEEANSSGKNIRLKDDVGRCGVSV